jgi:hypothetical protein
MKEEVGWRQASQEGAAKRRDCDVPVTAACHDPRKEQLTLRSRHEPGHFDVDHAPAAMREGLSSRLRILTSHMAL